MQPRDDGVATLGCAHICHAMPRYQMYLFWMFARTLPIRAGIRMPGFAATRAAHHGALPLPRTLQHTTRTLRTAAASSTNLLVHRAARAGTVPGRPRTRLHALHFAPRCACTRARAGTPTRTFWCNTAPAASHLTPHGTCICCIFFSRCLRPLRAFHAFCTRALPAHSTTHASQDSLAWPRARENTGCALSGSVVRYTCTYSACLTLRSPARYLPHSHCPLP